MFLPVSGEIEEGSSEAAHLISRLENIEGDIVCLLSLAADRLNDPSYKTKLVAN